MAANLLFPSLAICAPFSGGHSLEAHQGGRNLGIGYQMASKGVLNQSKRGSNVGLSTLKLLSSAIRRATTRNFPDLHDLLKSGSFTSYVDACISGKIEGCRMAECSCQTEMQHKC